ncbi:MAG: penicillin-binding protein [Micrococcales bacterium]|nr:penicillin-binding protein [Micrococcales bacterium]
MSSSKTPARKKKSPAAAGGARRGPRFLPKTWLGRIGAALLGLFLLGLAAIGVAFATVEIPKPNDVAVAQTSIIYYSDGKTEMDRISDVNRENVALSRVPLHVQRAMISAEDRSFYENNGISPKGIMRSVVVGIRGGEKQGGSTITQQYVKNYFLTQDRTISRKVKEILISVKIDGQLDKNKILENYLNTIYYGRGAYGIQTASKAYFNKDVKDLTVEEGALLASVINAPNNFDPGLGAAQRKNAESRFGYVISGMQAKGWITPGQAASMKFPATAKAKPYRGIGGPRGHIVKAIKDELEGTLKLTQKDIDTGGLRIVSTIDKKRQTAAEAAIKKRMPEDAGDIKIGLVSTVPGDGAVVAMYGGADYLKNQWNAAKDAKLQAGSTFKPFTLIAGLEQKIATSTVYSGASPQYFQEFADSGGKTAAERAGRVSNFGGQGFGDINLRTATANSVNTVYAKLNIRVGPKNTVRAARTAGITTPLGAYYSNVFGTDTVSVWDMARAYSTIAAEGKRTTPYLVKSITTQDKHFSYKHKVQAKQVFAKPVMADTIDAMERVVTEGSGTYASRLARPVAGKTGTTTNNYAAWFNGFTPQLETAVGMYKGDGTQKPQNQMKNVGGYAEITGGSIPVRVWTSYMLEAMDGVKWEDFPPRANWGIPGGTASPQRLRTWTPRPTQRQTQQYTPRVTPRKTTSSSKTSSSSSSTSTSTPTTAKPTTAKPTTTPPPKKTATSTPPPKKTATSTPPPKKTSTAPPPPPKQTSTAPPPPPKQTTTPPPPPKATQTSAKVASPAVATPAG